ncbi:peptidylprolyl isomerase [Brevundimonas lenta]|uniref:peptidylprolyl isomerase n=1 Tax=Brevundimonas lenta TaxID=424796 RepID=A0A7W6JG51_9CAUL|nr:peptidylprolyl isomerase [Brevundimonas lenta]MBB4083491.1 peptidylprolyl isomerase [Brevundimonas lenta]
MRFKFTFAAAVSAALLASAVPVMAQTAAPAAAEWRTIAPENLLVIQTAKGRILVELEPRIAPLAVERVSTLANRGFYDGHAFHRVIEGFMAQTGDPLGTGLGGSELPDVAGEFGFRRGRADGYVSLSSTPGGQLGIMGSMPVQTQPDAQMMVTSDFKAAAVGLFCQGVAGMARSNDPNSANSQFFLMMGPRASLNGQYTAFGRVVDGLNVVESLKVGSESEDGKVTNPDTMTRTRTAAALPEGQRPVVRVMNTNAPAFAALIETTRTARGAQFNVCDVQPPVQVVG